MIELILACAPLVDAHTVKEVIRVESEGNPIAVNINVKKDGSTFKHNPIRNKKDAIFVAKKAIQAGYNADLGYMQVNSRNLESLGFTVDDMFHACKNLKAGSKVLHNFYTAALKVYKDEQTALLAALSAYNTGSFKKGFENGYVARYTKVTYSPPKKKESLNQADSSIFSRTLKLNLDKSIDWNRQKIWR
ncbi:MAG: lytic transglycosylase domain-containing protein [Devosia sp.]